ncbi:dnaA protein [Lutimaribacter pacificus]|uniref:DnaA protein n=1 Tax=Lutimaribacter pacificus TaxID=391948 RepID=A0A1H0BJW6_9RHOB|nr:DnaA/Hda family protein [Lutimaribacter pacificus]SDN45936.1 dnaA protein [Lutimaribacter pacificus]SHJ55297.1 dnaA protein [Lutimaribacter pacificus]
MAEQLGFDLPVRTALGREDFFVSPANAMAVAMIEGWRTWPARKLLLTGPAGAGKTHLAHVWAADSGARIVAAADLAGADIPALAQTPVAVEDADRIAGDPASEEALFHLHNLVLAEGHSLLVTAAAQPQHWGLTLPDLQSRMQGTQAATLSPPDDRLLGAVLLKLFADRQINPTPDALNHLLRHMTRDFATARAVVAEMDRAALAGKRRISMALARDVLARIDTP